MTELDPTVESRIDRLHGPGVVDMHFDLLMDLYEKRKRANVLSTDFLSDMRAGGMGVIGVAIYIEDNYLPEMGLRVGLAQIARLMAEVDQSPDFAICRSYAEIVAARHAGQIALLITMEGVEPLSGDPDMLRVFHGLGVRSLGLTHSRRNRAGEGGIFAPSGSSPQGLTHFGKEIVRQCAQLGIIIDLAHLNAAGVDDVLAMSSKPVILSHTNPRAFFDIERNSSNEQIRAVGERGGVVGVNAVLLSDQKSQATVDGFVDQITYVADLAGIDSVGIGFDFVKFIIDQAPNFPMPPFDIHFPPNLTHHGHTRNLTRKLIERGFADRDIEKVLYGNWMRLFETLLSTEGSED